MSHEDDVRRLGRTIRQLYIDEKSRVLGKPYKPSGRHDRQENFQKAAALCIELEADPLDMIQAAMRYCGMKGGPFPNALGGPAMRGWYQMHLLALGVGPRTRQTVKDGKTIETIVYACDMDLKMDLEIVQSVFKHSTGSTDPHHPGNLALLRDPFNEFIPSARCMLGCFDAETLTRFGEEILDYFARFPNYQAAAERMGYPMPDILQWIKTALKKQ